MLMHFLLDEKTNSIIILNFRESKVVKQSLHQSPGQGLQVNHTRVHFSSLGMLAKMSRGLLCQTNREENVYQFFFCSLQVLFKCTLSQQVHQKAIELLLEHIMQGEFLLECCQGFFYASVIGISGTLSFSEAKNICLQDRKNV